MPDTMHTNETCVSHMHDKLVKHAIVYGDNRVYTQSYTSLSPGLNTFIPGVQTVYKSSCNIFFQVLNVCTLSNKLHVHTETNMCAL